MDHQERAGAVVRPIIGVREAHVDGEVVAGVRIHQARGDRIEALRRLPIAFLDLGTELTRPAADRIGLEQRLAAGLVFLPDLELGLFLEDANQDRRFLAMFRCSISAIIAARAAAASAASAGAASVSQPASATAAQIAADAKSERTSRTTVQPRDSPD